MHMYVSTVFHRRWYPKTMHGFCCTCTITGILSVVVEVSTDMCLYNHNWGMYMYTLFDRSAGPSISNVIIYLFWSIREAIKFDPACPRRLTWFVLWFYLMLPIYTHTHMYIYKHMYVYMCTFTSDRENISVFHGNQASIHQWSYPFFLAFMLWETHCYPNSLYLPNTAMIFWLYDLRINVLIIRERYMEYRAATSSKPSERWRGNRSGNSLTFFWAFNLLWNVAGKFLITVESRPVVRG